MLNHSKSRYNLRSRYNSPDQIEQHTIARQHCMENVNCSATTAVIFDLDGVIIDSMPFHFKAWEKAFHLVGINVIKKHIYEREGEERETTTREIYKLYKGEYPPDEMTRIIIEVKEKTYKQIFKFRILPGVTELLELLKKRGIKRGLTTGSTSVLFNFQDRGDFLSYFDVIVTGGEAEHCKPFPDPYLLTLKKLNIPSSACLVIENAPLGIQSAIAAGLNCIAVKGTSPLSKKLLKRAGAHSVYENLVQLNTVLKQELS